MDCIFSSTIGMAAPGELLVFANGDIIVTPAFVTSVMAVRNKFTTPLEVMTSFAVTKWSPGFVMVGQRTDVTKFDHLIPSSRILDHPAVNALVKGATKAGTIHSGWGIDYLVLPPHVFPKSFPPYLVGRWRWDNSLLLDFITADVPSVDATATNPVIHLGGGTAKAGQVQRSGGEFNSKLASTYYGEAVTLGSIKNTRYALKSTEKGDGGKNGKKGVKPESLSLISQDPATTDQKLLLALRRSSAPRFHRLDDSTGGLTVAYPFLLLVNVWKDQLDDANKWVLLADRLLGDYKHYAFMAMDEETYQTLGSLYPDRVLNGESWLSPTSRYVVGDIECCSTFCRIGAGTSMSFIHIGH